MKPKIDFVSIAVDDIPRALAFYQAMLDSSDDCIRHGEDHVSISLENGFTLVLYSREELAKFPRKRGMGEGSAFILSHLTENREQVGEILGKAEAAGAVISKAPEAYDYGYYGYFEDPDGHLWEIGCD